MALGVQQLAIDQSFVLCSSTISTSHVHVTSAMVLFARRPRWQLCNGAQKVPRGHSTQGLRGSVPAVGICCSSNNFQCEESLKGKHIYF